VYENQEDNVALENDQNVLKNDVLLDAAGVLDVTVFTKSANKFSKSGVEDAQATDFPMEMVAQIKPPKYSNAQNLTASHVYLEGNYAYVSYNTPEAQYAGALDIIDISDPRNPFIRSRLYYTNADINAITYSNGYVYAAGGFDSEKSTRSEENSFVARLSASNGYFSTSNIKYAFQEGFVGNGVMALDGSVYVTSGRDGVLGSYEPNTLDLQNSYTYQDLRSIAYKDNMFALLDGGTGVRLLDGNFQSTGDIAITADLGHAKRTLDFYDGHIVVSEGDKGAGVYDLTNGNLVKYIPIALHPDGVASSDIVTNAVSANEELLFMANGGGGLAIAKNDNGQLETVGLIEIKGSINYVESKGDYLFAASGTEGLQVIKLNRPDTSLEAVCATYSTYWGTNRLTIADNDEKGYRGSKAFNRITVGKNADLTLCGSWTVRNDVRIEENGTLAMNGYMLVGSNNRKKKIIVEEGATLKIEGDIIVYGDIELKDGASILFIGEGNQAYVSGQVKKGANVSVTGNFTDTLNKF
jgi:hypothetical protein